MPNLNPPIVTVAQAKAFRERILQDVPQDASFNPLMTLYLQENTPISAMREAKNSGMVYGFITPTPLASPHTLAREFVK